MKKPIRIKKQIRLYATTTALISAVFGLSFGVAFCIAKYDLPSRFVQAAQILDISDAISADVKQLKLVTAKFAPVELQHRNELPAYEKISYYQPKWHELVDPFVLFESQNSRYYSPVSEAPEVHRPKVAGIIIKLPRLPRLPQPAHVVSLSAPYNYVAPDLKQIAGLIAADYQELKNQKYEVIDKPRPSMKKLSFTLPPKPVVAVDPPPYSFDKPQWFVAPIALDASIVKSLQATKAGVVSGVKISLTWDDINLAVEKILPSKINAPSDKKNSDTSIKPSVNLPLKSTVTEDLIKIIGGNAELKKLLRGPQGERGLQGLAGLPGLQGPIGPQGPAGSGASTTAIIVSHAFDNAVFNNIDYDWPGSQGAASTVLTNDGSGNLSWSAAGSGSQTPWNSNIDADNFSLLDFGTNLTARAGLTVASGGTSDLALNSGSGILTSNGTTFTLGGSATINGGTASSGTLTLVSTTHGTKGDIQFFSSSNKITSAGALTVAGALSASNFSGTSSGTNTGDQNLFSSIPVSGQTTVTANSATTALTLIAGSNVTLTTDNTAKSITIAAAGGGGSQSPWTSDIDADNFSLLDFGPSLTSRAATTIGSANNGSGASGLVTLNTGTGTTSTGGVTIVSGNASAGTAGNISINVGTSSSSNGSIFIGTAARTQTITIGNSTGGVITIGASSGSGLVLNDAQWSVSDAGAAAFASISEGGTALDSKYAPLNANFVSVTANGTLTGETGIDALSTAISTTSTLNVDSSSTLNAVTIDANANLVLSSGTGSFQQTYSNSSAGNAQTLSLTSTTSGAGATIGGLSITPVNNTNPSSGTNTLNVINFAAGTNGNDADNTTNGINFASATGYKNFLNSPSLVISSAGAITGATGVSSTTGTFSSAIAANGGITFDASTDTLGAHTLSGTVDASTQIITNIGNTGTDFIASTGALTLAGDLTLTNNTLVCTACVDVTDIGANAVDDSELVDTLTYTGALTLTPGTTTDFTVN